MILEVQNISYKYHLSDRQVFEDVSFSLDPGRVLTILGPNGSGKSTLLNCLVDLLSPQSGQILLGGKRLGELSPKQIAQNIGYVQQNNDPTFAFIVRDFVTMGCTPYLSMFQRPQKEHYQSAEKAIKEMNISHIAQKPYTEISGGERQQACIARVIVQKPKIILFDEPTAHLDFGNQIRVIQMIARLSEQGYAVIMTTHNPEHAILLDDMVGILDRNGHITVGQCRQIVTEDILKEVYTTDLRMIYIEEMQRNVCVCPRIAKNR